MDSRLSALAHQGQSVWLDYIDRKMIEDGSLANLIDLGVTGVTTNPTIFHKAIAGGDRYDDSIRRWMREYPDGDIQALLERLMIEDVDAAADLLHATFESTGGEDGYVSLEVSPMLARDTEATIEAAQRLAAALAAPNVMIKIPATLEGLPAIEEMLAHGLNVNVTLLFSLQRYTQVLSAWQSGMRRVGAPGGTASVASFFVSRIDTLVDRALEELGGEEALALRGRVAVASARLAYRHFTKHMASPAFVELSARGGRMQRLLWGSTGTKNEAYSDVKYVEELIGRHTVNTMPPATLEAFMDHGVVAETLLLDVDDAQQTIERLERMGISLAAVTAQLEREGIEAFADSHRQLLDALTAKRQTLAEE